MIKQSDITKRDKYIAELQRKIKELERENVLLTWNLDGLAEELKQLEAQQHTNYCKHTQHIGERCTECGGEAHV